MTRPFPGNTESRICSFVVGNMRYRLTGDIITGLILFLLVICEIGKTAKLEGFGGVGEAI